MHKITLHDGVTDVIRNAQDRITEAEKWVWEVNPVRDQEGWEDRKEKLDEMKASFHEGLTRLMATPATDGELEIFPDGKLGLFWRYASGYHGGFVFHVRHSDDLSLLPVGTWSIHT